LGLVINQVEGELTVLEPDAEYVWVSCPTMTPIEGATSQTFFPSQNGDYAVMVTANGCTDTSECFTYIYSGVRDEHLNLEVAIFPNPSNGNFLFNLNRPHQDVTIRILDLTGRIVFSQTLDIVEQLEMKLDETSGVYWIVIESAGKQAVSKLILE
jgi:hypothetical protein